MYVFLTKPQFDTLKGKGLDLSAESFERDDNTKGFLVAKEDLHNWMDGEEIAYEMKGQIFEGIENISFGSVSAGTPKVVKTKGMVEIKSKPGAAPTHIDVDAPEANWDGKGRDKFVAIAMDEFKGIFSKVHMSVPNGEVEPPNDADYELNIRIWSSPNEKAIRGGGKDLKPPEKLFGEPVACRDASFEPMKKGSQSFESDGFVWGEFISPNYLYIFFDVCQKDTAGSLAIFRAMLKQMIKEVTPDVLRAGTGDIAKKREEKARNELRGFMKSMLSAQFASSKQKVETLTKDIEQMHNKIVQLIRDRTYNMNLFKAFEEEEIDKKIGIMIRDLYQDKNIIGLKVDGNLFKVFTDTLYVTDPRTNWKYELGKFRLDLDCTQGMIRIFNLTRTVSAYGSQKMNAPHVFANNTMCAGNFVETTAELFGKHDYGNLASTLVIFLESVNVEDGAGRMVYRWPRINADGTLTEYDKLSKEDKAFLHEKGVE
jgi:hypothetical protein